MILLKNREEEGVCSKEILCLMHKASHMEWDEYSKIENDLVLECPHCDWTGTAEGNKEYYNDLFDVSCPKCEKMILIVSYPLIPN